VGPPREERLRFWVEDDEVCTHGVVRPGVLLEASEPLYLDAGQDLEAHVGEQPTCELRLLPEKEIGMSVVGEHARGRVPRSGIAERRCAAGRPRSLLVS